MLVKEEKNYEVIEKKKENIHKLDAAERQQFDDKHIEYLKDAKTERGMYYTRKHF